MQDAPGSPSVERGLIRLQEMDTLCRKILAQIPDAHRRRSADLPEAVAEKIAVCDCDTLYSILSVCLIRLIGEAVAPPNGCDASDSATSRTRPNEEA